MAARLIDCGDAYATSDTFYFFLDTKVTDILLEQLKGIRKKRIPAASKNRERSKAIINAWNIATLMLVAPTYPPPFDEVTGEPNFIVSDKYEILDQEALLAALAAAPRVRADLDMKYDENGVAKALGWNLYDEEDANKNLLFIVIEFQKPDCIATLALNLDRADPGREQFREFAGKNVRFLERTFFDLSENVNVSDPSAESPETESPPS
jgi:hypothetical protein